MKLTELSVFQATGEPLQRLSGVFLKQALAYYAKMDISSLALLAGGLLDEMFETLTPLTTHGVNQPSAKVDAAHMIHPCICSRHLIIRSSAARQKVVIDLECDLKGAMFSRAS